MSLDEQLRAALHHEAGKRAPTRPDIDGMISGGKARRRHRRLTRMGVAVTVAVLVGSGVYGVRQVELGDRGPRPGAVQQPTPSPDTTTAPPLYLGQDEALAPGVYRKRVGTDVAGAPLDADLTFPSPGWYGGDQPAKEPAGAAGAVGVAVFQAGAVPGTSGCTQAPLADPTFRKAATTPEALSRQFATLPASTVLQPITPTAAFGYDARYLRLRIDTRCPRDKVYMVAGAATGDLGITYRAPWKVVIDVLVVDVQGTPIVVAVWHDAHASGRLVDEAVRVRDSVRFVPSTPSP